MKQKAQISLIVDYDGIPKYLLYLLEQEGSIDGASVLHENIKKFLREKKTIDAKNAVIELRERLVQIDSVLSNLEAILQPPSQPTETIEKDE